MQNETNHWSTFSGKDERLAKQRFIGLNYHNFHIFITNNFKTHRYLNNSDEKILLSFIRSYALLATWKLHVYINFI